VIGELFVYFQKWLSAGAVLCVHFADSCPAFATDVYWAGFAYQGAYFEAASRHPYSADQRGFG
jgi:hypothetical protein